MKSIPTQFTEKNNPNRTFKTLALGLAISTVLAACQPAVSETASALAPPSIPVLTVSERLLETGPMQLARIEAVERVNIQPRVAGHIDAVLFREGEHVQAGQPLFRIDSRTFDTAVARASAELQLAQAREQTAESEALRARQLDADGAISGEEAERREGVLATAIAQRAYVEAVLQSAKLELDYALVRAPISGRIGRALLTAGNYIAATADQQPLATIIATDAVHVHFDVADPKVVRSFTAKTAASQWEVRVFDGADQQELARVPLDFADNEIAAATGTLRLRARIDADAVALLPGQYVQVQLVTESPTPTVLVPDGVIGTDQGRHFVFVVGPDSTVEYRPVHIGAAHDGLREIESGLQTGELVVASGLMRVSPGMTVSPQLVSVAHPEQSAVLSL